MLREDLHKMGFNNNQIDMYFKSTKKKIVTEAAEKGKKAAKVVMKEWFDDTNVRNVIEHLRKCTVINI